MRDDGCGSVVIRCETSLGDGRGPLVMCGVLFLGYIVMI